MEPTTVLRVGGAVRNHLLDLPIDEQDWVVVGSTPEELLRAGYKPVGKDFPVFLHPETHEEYALARTERKTGPGHTGFACYFGQEVTLEEDLLRRDLTINAMAQDPNTQVIIDPYGGQDDLRARILRHVSPAFSEDPLRVLRTARFAAQLVGFTVHPDTMAFLHAMADAGDLDDLVAERVWVECDKALAAPDPERFFTVLQECGALPHLFPEWVAADYPQAMVRLQRSVQRTHDAVLRCAAWLSPMPVAAIKTLAQRLRLPVRYRDIAVLAASCQEPCAHAEAAAPEALATLLHTLDAFRRPERCFEVLSVCAAIQALSEAGHRRLKAAYTAASGVHVHDLIDAGHQGVELGRALQRARIVAIARVAG